MTKTMQSLLPHNPVTIAKLKGLKSIIRVETARTRKWYLVIPATGNSDAKCIEVRSEGRKESLRHDKVDRTWVEISDHAVISQYEDRIISIN